MLFWSQQQPPGKQKQGEESRKQAQCLGARYETAVTVGSGIWDAVYQQLMAWLLSSIYSLLHDFGKHRLFWQFLTCFPESFLQIQTLRADGCSWCSRLLETSSVETRTLLQENLLGSLLAESHVCHGLKLFFIISHDLKLFKSAVKRLLGAVHLGLTVTCSSVLMETNLWTARKAPAEEEAGLRACSKVTVGKSNVSYLTCCCSQRQGFWLSEWCLSTKPQVRTNSFSEVLV